MKEGQFTTFQDKLVQLDFFLTDVRYDDAARNGMSQLTTPERLVSSGYRFSDGKSGLTVDRESGKLALSEGSTATAVATFEGVVELREEIEGYLSKA